MTQRNVYVVHTNAGLVGLGEDGGGGKDLIDHYIGTSPFDHINDTVSLGLGTAMCGSTLHAAGRHRSMFCAVGSAVSSSCFFCRTVHPAQTT